MNNRAEGEESVFRFPSPLLLSKITDGDDPENMNSETIFNPETERLDHINERLSLIQSKKGLTFGTDSYLLAAFARPRKNGVCVEFGSGTGVVSCLAASRGKYRRIYAVEVQEYFAGLTSRNASLNALSDVIIPLTGDIRVLGTKDTGGECDAVITNPPYMKDRSGKAAANAEMSAARREENGTIADFCRSASRILKSGGYFTAVYRPDRCAELLFRMKENRLEPKRIIFVYPSVSSKPCLILAEGKKDSSEGVVVSRPLIIYEGECGGVYTSDMQAVYDSFSLEHLF